MPNSKCLARCVLGASVLVISASQAHSAEKLSDILNRSKWSGLVGTWVDAETNGAAYKVTHSWKIQDRVIESLIKEGSKESVALMAVNGQTGEVFHIGADSEGNSSLGKWEVKPDGDAVLGVAYTSATGQQGALNIRYHWVDPDHLTMTRELPQPIQIKLIRVPAR